MTDYSFVAGRVEKARAEIAAAAARAGRDPASITFMAVTKFHPVEAVEAAYAAGLRVFGESRVQEAEAKFPDFLATHPGARLELIGSLQSNKAKKACALFSRVQSVDSLGLIAELNKRATALGMRAQDRGAGPGAEGDPGLASALPGRLEVLLELHTGEESKAGFPDLDSLLRAAEAVLACPGLELRGLMTMAPYTRDEAPIRASFRALRAAFGEVARRFPSPRFDVLSMGMTNDYAIAVEEGSTLLRIGTALFGDRAAP